MDRMSSLVNIRAVQRRAFSEIAAAAVPVSEKHLRSSVAYALSIRVKSPSASVESVLNQAGLLVPVALRSGYRCS